jgi:hypothetical protein
VNLDRTILVRAAEGVLGEGGATPAASGRILRYRLWAPVPPELDVYGSTNKEGEEVAFDYTTSDKWEDLNTFEDFTELDARLTLTLQTKEEAESLANATGPVLFTWIAADETVFDKDIVKARTRRIPKRFWSIWKSTFLLNLGRRQRVGMCWVALPLNQAARSSLNYQRS